MLESTSLVALNHGLIDRRALARIDVKRAALAAQVMVNWLPRVLGPMTMRPGLGYLYGVFENLACKYLHFIFSTTDTALLEMTPGLMRIAINDVLLARPAVSTTITNGAFTTDLTGWTSMDDMGATSSWVAPGYMQLLGNGTARAIREQAVTCLNPGVEHGIRVTIARGPVSLRIGSSSGDDSYVNETVLNTGTHSLSIVPTGTFYIRFFSLQLPVVWVSRCTIEAAGVVTVPTPWMAADLSNIRYDQSADVVFVACLGYQQRRIERRGARPNGRSWSVALYTTPDGPFKIENVGPTTISANGTTGNVTLSSSVALFKSGHIGALFSITSVGQLVTLNASSANVFSAAVRITGLSAQRSIFFNVTGIFSATVVVQRSFDDATWTDIAITFTAPGNNGYNDGLDNQIAFYRIGIESGNYVSGTAVCTASAPQGSIRGVARVTDFTNSTTVGAEVVVALGGTAASTTWQEGQWSPLNSWPTAGGLHEGRLWWSGQNGIWGSISDAFDSFDETFLGDAGPINRTIGSGPVDVINWLISLQRLILGAQGAEYGCRSSSLDEPLTPTNFNVKAPSTQGSGALSGLKIDSRGYFIDRTACKLFELAFNIQTYDYLSSDLMKMVPELGLPGIVRMDVQRKPETRVHCVRSDGSVIVLVMDREEEVLAWSVVTTQGLVEDVVVLPALAGNLDDQVYYVVNRAIAGQTVRYLEKWAQEVNCRGAATSQLADAYLTLASPGQTVSVPHLAGQQVVVWADGQDIGTDDSDETWTQVYMADGSGNVTLPTPFTSVTIGLPYGSQFQSAKLGSITQAGSPLNRQKKVDGIGIVAADLHPKGIRFGPDFDHIDDMPSMEDGAPVGTASRVAYDENVIPFPGTWTTDARVCIVGAAPRPATVLGITPYVEMH